MIFGGDHIILICYIITFDYDFVMMMIILIMICEYNAIMILTLDGNDILHYESFELEGIKRMKFFLDFQFV